MVGGAAVATVTDNGPDTVAPLELADVVVDSSIAVPNSVDTETPVTVEAGEVEGASGPVSTPVSPDAGVSQNSAVVPGLTEKSGVVQLFGDDFYLEGRELDFGPDRWMISTRASGDVDGDGARESWWNEISGVVGQRVTVLGDVDDDDIDVFQINSFLLRPFDRPAPWSDDWDDRDKYDDDMVPATTRINMDEAKRIALQQVAGTIIAVELDADDGVVYWELEVRSTDGALYDIEIDAESGRVIEVDRD